MLAADFNPHGETSRTVHLFKKGVNDYNFTVNFGACRRRITPFNLKT